MGELIYLDDDLEEAVKKGNNKLIAEVVRRAIQSNQNVD